MKFVVEITDAEAKEYILRMAEKLGCNSWREPVTLLLVDAGRRIFAKPELRLVTSKPILDEDLNH
jgi:hypothetical protein